MFWSRPEALACGVSGIEQARVVIIRPIAMDSGSSLWVRNCAILSNLPPRGVDFGFVFSSDVSFGV